MQHIDYKLINATLNKNTIPVDVPNKQTDYIMYSNIMNCDVLSSAVVNEKIISDHRRH